MIEAKGIRIAWSPSNIRSLRNRLIVASLRTATDEDTVKYGYQPSALVPVTPFRTPSLEEASAYIATETTDPRMQVYLVHPGEAFDGRMRYLRSERLEAKYVKGSVFSLFDKMDYSGTLAGVIHSDPNLLTTTIIHDGEEHVSGSSQNPPNSIVALHVDNWDGLSGANRISRSRSRFLYNAGEGQRILLFVPSLSVTDIEQDTELPESGYIRTKEVREYLSTHSEHLTCVGLTFDAGEALIFPSENTIHDGSTHVRDPLEGMLAGGSTALAFLELPYARWEFDRIRRASLEYSGQKGREKVNLKRGIRRGWPELRSDEEVAQFIAKVQNELMTGVFDDGDQGDATSGTPFNEFILKIHKRCDLGCPNCYWYQNEPADVRRPQKQTQLEITDDPQELFKLRRERSQVMLPETVVAVATRIAQHVRQHGLDSIQIVLHGGEPLLAGKVDPYFYLGLTKIFQMLIPEGVQIDYRIQTNGVLLTEEELRQFEQLGIKVGISLDGTQAQHDAARPHHDGSGSYEEVVKAIDKVEGHRDIYSRLYTVIDTDFDPIATYEELLRHHPPFIDFLFPHNNWSDLPKNHNPFGENPTTAYADWLIPIFDRWFEDRDAPHIRLFESIIRLINNQGSIVESLGMEPPTDVMVQADGMFGGVDSLLSVDYHAADTGMDVFSNSLNEVLEHPLIQEMQSGVDSLSDTCRGCVLQDICGGGLYAHRFSKEENIAEALMPGFKNHSVYCADLIKLIGHVADKMYESSVKQTIETGVSYFMETIHCEFPESALMRGVAIAERCKRQNLNPKVIGKALIEEMRGNEDLQRRLFLMVYKQIELYDIRNLQYETLHSFIWAYKMMGLDKDELDDIKSWYRRNPTSEFGINGVRDKVNYLIAAKREVHDVEVYLDIWGDVVWAGTQKVR